MQERLRVWVKEAADVGLLGVIIGIISASVYELVVFVSSKMAGAVELSSTAPHLFTRELWPEAFLYVLFVTVVGKIAVDLMQKYDYQQWLLGSVVLCTIFYGGLVATAALSGTGNYFSPHAFLGHGVPYLILGGLFYKLDHDEANP